VKNDGNSNLVSNNCNYNYRLCRLEAVKICSLDSAYYLPYCDITDWPGSLPGFIFSNTLGVPGIMSNKIFLSLLHDEKLITIEIGIRLIHFYFFFTFGKHRQGNRVIMIFFLKLVYAFFHRNIKRVYPG